MQFAVLEHYRSIKYAAPANATRLFECAYLFALNEEPPRDGSRAPIRRVRNIFQYPPNVCLTSSFSSTTLHSIIIVIILYGTLYCTHCSNCTCCNVTFKVGSV